MFTVHLLNCVLLLLILIHNKARDDEISFDDIKKVGEGECALFVTMLSYPCELNSQFSGNS